MPHTDTVSRMRTALTIAGSDSGGGAGIQADLKTFAAHDIYGVCALTAVTAQNTLGVTANDPVSPPVVAAQIDAVMGDFNVVAIKTGMLNGVFQTMFNLQIKNDDLLESLRLTHLIAVNLIVYGILLGLADKFGRKTRSFEDVRLIDGLLVGLAQSLALIPGTSRSGVTMTMARTLGFARVEAARFSFLLSIPAIAGAGILIVPDLLNADPALLMSALITGGLTFLAALGTMVFLMRFLKNASMMVFVVYRVLMGAALLYFF